MTKSDFVPKIPYGTKDFLVAEASRKRGMEAALAELFARWGYQEVVTPTFEYLEIFDSGTLSEQAFKFFDRAGNTLALRPDMTGPIARLACTRLREWQCPKRLSYIANVFRYEQAQAGRQCEFYQAGVELLGVSEASADAEIVALAVETVKSAGLDSFKISLGHVDFLNGLIEKTGLQSEQKEQIRVLLSQRDLAGLELFMDEVALAEPIRSCLQQVLFLHGGKELLAKADSLAANELSSRALANLAEIYEMLEGYGVADKIDFDLGLIRDFGYYTGMVFEGYTVSLGFPICGGGRYDNMMSSFGQECPATGFSAGIDRLLLALGRVGEQAAMQQEVYVGWAEGCFAQAITQAAQLRKSGKRVEVALLAQSREEAARQAGKRQLVYMAG